MSIREKTNRREKDLRQLIELETPMTVPQVKNSFASDKGLLEMLTPQQKAELLDQLLATVPQGREIDLSKPVTPHYRHQEFPKMVYHHEGGQVLEVADERQLKAAEKKGFQRKPAADRDYSKIQNGIAAMKPVVAPTEVEFAQEVFADAE